MTPSVFRRFAAVLAALAVLLVTTGALVTSIRSSAPAGSPPPSDSIHRFAAILTGIAAVGVALLASASGKRPQLRLGSMAGVAIFGVAAIVGVASEGNAPAGARIAHAILAPVFLAISVGIAAASGPAWQREPELVKDYGWPSMRSLAVLVPILVLLQIAMGVAFRQGAMTVMPHIVGAMIVALIIMITGAFGMHQFPGHKTLRPAALWLLIATGAQVMLGMTAFIARMMVESASPVLLASTVAHVVVGALTLAASVAFAIEVRRNVLPKKSGE
jgi:heme A synthase